MDIDDYCVQDIASIQIKFKGSKTFKFSIGRVFAKDFIITSTHSQLFNDILVDFNEFWETNGYALVLKSWTEKYSEFINPEYSTESPDNTKDLDNTNNFNKSDEDFSAQWADHWKLTTDEVYLNTFLDFILIDKAQDTCSLDCPLLSSEIDCYLDAFSSNFDQLDISDKKSLYEIKYNILRHLFRDLCLNFTPENVEKSSIKFLTFSINTKMNDSTICLSRKSIHTYFNDDDDDDDGNTINNVKGHENGDNNCDQKEDALIMDINANDNYFQNTTLITNGTEEKDAEIDNSKSKQKRKRKRNNNRKRNPASSTNESYKLKNKLKCYWLKRYSLFSKFDCGIRLDPESWFSVTPEVIAKNIAKKCKCNVIIDGFCGAGGNTIQFAMTCDKVLAIDIDPKKIEMAKHNAQIYGVDNKIEFIVADFFHIYKDLKADGLFLSPPWGGPDYKKMEVYDLKNLQPLPASQLLEKAREITKNIGIYLPKNCDVNQILTYLGCEHGEVEIQQNFLSNRLIALTAFSGDFVNSASNSDSNN